jgi:hypothetical protein
MQLLVIPTVMAIEFATSGKTTPLHEKLCLVVLLLGVGISTVTDVALTRVRMCGRVRVCGGGDCGFNRGCALKLQRNNACGIVGALSTTATCTSHFSRWMGACA